MAQSNDTDLFQLNLQTQGEFYETRAEVYDLFNERSNNAITIMDGNIIGERAEKGFFLDRDTVTRRDTTSLLARPLAGMVQDSITRVVVKGRGSDDQVISDLIGRGINFGGYASQVSAKIAEDMIASAFNDAVSSLAGTLLKQATTNLVVGAEISTDSIMDAKALFGDREGSLGTMIMHSNKATALKKTLVATSNVAFTEIGASIIRDNILSNHLGMTVYVTDNANLLIAGAPDTYRTLLLPMNAVNVISQDTRPIKGYEDESFENSVWRTFVEFSNEIEVRGFSYNNAAKNPAQSALALPANWLLKASSVKNAAGVILVTD